MGDISEFLPKQAKPVQRKFPSTQSSAGNADGVEPQGDCFCWRPNPDAPATYWCNLGRSMWNTGIPCDPGQ